MRRAIFTGMRAGPMDVVQALHGHSHREEWDANPLLHEAIAKHVEVIHGNVQIKLGDNIDVERRQFLVYHVSVDHW